MKNLKCKVEAKQEIAEKTRQKSQTKSIEELHKWIRETVENYEGTHKNIKLEPVLYCLIYCFFVTKCLFYLLYGHHTQLLTSSIQLILNPNTQL